MVTTCTNLQVEKESNTKISFSSNNYKEKNARIWCSVFSGYKGTNKHKQNGESSLH